MEEGMRRGSRIALLTFLVIGFVGCVVFSMMSLSRDIEYTAKDVLGGIWHYQTMLVMTVGFLYVGSGGAKG